MRFRTRVTNIALFHKIIRSLVALAKTGVIRLSTDVVHFIIPGNEGRDGVQVWSQVQVPILFDYYRIESNANNEIWLEINLEALLKVLRSADGPGVGDNSRHGATSVIDDVMLKLNKRDNRAIWAFDIKGHSANGHPIHISHEVTVTILSPRRQNELNEPLCPPPDVHIVLPNLADLKNIVSRLGHLSDDITVSANHVGTLELTVKSNKVETSTTWMNLRIPQSDAIEPAQRDSDQLHKTKVSVRGFQKFLTSHHVGGTAIACICEGHCVIAYVYIGEVNESGGVLTFFIPAKLD